MDQLWANRAASAEAAIAKRHLKTAVGAAGHPARRGGLAADPAATGGSAPGTTGGRRTCWTAWSTRRCATRSRERRDVASPGRSAGTGCATTVAGPTTTTTTWRGWRWRWSGPAGSPASSGRRRCDKLADQFLNAWVPEDGGGIPWRKQDQFFNAPANGPAGIFLARYDDRLRRAQQMADWIDETLIDPETHLVFDGIKAGSLVRAQYTYCQGVVLGLETELAVRTDDARHAAAGAPAGRRGRTSTWRPTGVHQGRRRRRRRAVRRDHRALPGAGGHRRCPGDSRRGRRGPRDRAPSSC